MRIDTRFLDWGIFFILVGAIPLAVQAGWLDASIVAGWWRFWPLLIVGAGIGVLLRHTPLHFVGGMVGALALGLMVGGVFGGGVGVRLGDLGCGGGTGGSAFPAQTGSFAAGGSVELDLRCGDLTLSNGGPGWSVAGTSRDGIGPDVVASADRLSVRARDTRTSFGPFSDASEAWRVGIPATATAVDLTLSAGSGTVALGGTNVAAFKASVNAGSTKIDLSGTPLKAVHVDVNAGSATLNLPATDVSGSLTVNAGSIRFCVPAGVGLQFTTNDDITGGNDFGQHGLTKSGGVWQSADWATAPAHITLATNANVGSLTLNPEEGCK